MLSSASRRTDRFAAATGALLLQLGFIAAFLYANPPLTPHKQYERELIFFLPRLLPKPTPTKPTALPPAPAAVLNIPAFALPLVSLTPAPPVANAPPTVLENLGRQLFGCASENYTSLTPQQRAACPYLGEGMAIQSVPPLEGQPSQVKDNPRWANALAHEKSPLLLPGAGKCAGVPPPCIVIIGVDDDGNVSGLLGASSDPESWPTYVDPKSFMPLPVIKPQRDKPAAPQDTSAGPK